MPHALATTYLSTGTVRTRLIAGWLISQEQYLQHPIHPISPTSPTSQPLSQFLRDCKHKSIASPESPRLSPSAGPLAVQN
ncbi:hypothetical protein DTO207G8_1445 [Paecilomyces variotii]|nr:hypothetical protein DTO207G8_1445 [Paecilomyces variotii]